MYTIFEHNEILRAFVTASASKSNFEFIDVLYQSDKKAHSLYATCTYRILADATMKKLYNIGPKKSICKIAYYIKFLNNKNFIYSFFD